MESLQIIKSTDMMEIQFKAIALDKTKGAVRKLSRDDIFQLIDVHEPYYALQDVSADANNFATARIRPEQPVGHEILPVSAAEACRHLAILGSVCCALVNPVKQKHYYLAHAGTYRRSMEREYYAASELIATAECTFFSKRKATIKACLLDNQNQLICGIDATFHVLHHTLFERFYADLYREVPVFGQKNPYYQKNPLFDLSFSGPSASASLGKIQDTNCAGHFPQLPALPVAILMNSLLDLATAYIHHVTGNNLLKLCVREMTLLADNLGLSGETVTLHLKQEASLDNRFRLRCTAVSTGNKSIGDITAIIDTIRKDTDL